MSRLLALLRFHRAREAARAVDGDLVLLADQDRSAWDAALTAAAHTALERAAAARRPGRFQLQAAIAACHADAPSLEATDWLQVLTLYDLLAARDSSPLVRLNRIVALAHVAGPDAGLQELDTLESALVDYHLWHALRAHLLRQTGREAEADAADLRALELTANRAEQRLVAARVRRPSAR